MTLADYLATEQAREDVTSAVGGYPVKRNGIYVRGEFANPWIKMVASAASAEISAYFRPDGDRYIVTDLGEGVRALRLRTGIGHRDAVIVADGARNQADEKEPRIGDIWVSTRGIVEIDGVKPEHLPDAICRVMLASLKVAGVGR